MLAAGDLNLLTDIPALNVNKMTKWEVKNPKTESKLFSTFD
jgi:hypothetical protein